MDYSQLVDEVHLNTACPLRDNPELCVALVAANLSYKVPSSGVRVLWSSDREFSRFPELTVVNPLPSE